MKKQDNQAYATTVGLKTSVQKLGLVVDLIRGQRVDYADSILSFSRKKMAVSLRKTLRDAVANAENNHNLDVDRLKVVRVDVGKYLTMKRMRPRAKGRGSRILRPLSRVTVVVEEQEEMV